ncbi:SRPBCC family protein [Acidisphaera sp. S103]|uniref:SRPBCC family protein n=1 Tax=Acidisphaera sp. S103 TaxID=1747223 RepID=UPI00131B625F|nr:SRPBCC family protein [Acidisphaera sp. S103]
MTDSINKTIVLNAPIDRVWRALTDHSEFGEWFRVRLDGPFIRGQQSTGHITYPGFEHVLWRATIETMDQPTLFAFTWHPYAVDPNVDYTQEPPTRVTFQLEPVPTGTRLTITESGFDALPPDRKPIALRMNDGGWSTQLTNIRTHVES